MIYLIPLFCYAQELTASWYSIESLHKDGQWNITKGVMSDGTKFSDSNLTCATGLYALGTMLRITPIQRQAGKSAEVIVKVCDRIGKRFIKTRIDLSKAAFEQIADLKKGLIDVKIIIFK